MKKIKFKLVSSDKLTLNLYIFFLKKLFKTLKLNISIVRTPTKIKRLSLLKSPHVHKKAFSQFEIKLYSCYFICDISNLKIKSSIKDIFYNKPKNLKLYFKALF